MWRKDADEGHVGELRQIGGDRGQLVLSGSSASLGGIGGDDSGRKLDVCATWVRYELTVVATVLAELDICQLRVDPFNADVESKVGRDLREHTPEAGDVGTWREDEGVITVTEEGDLREMLAKLGAEKVHHGTIAAPRVEVTALSRLGQLADLVAIRILRAVVVDVGVAED